MATKPEFLVAKEKLLVALATITVTFLSPVSVILWGNYWWRHKMSSVFSG